MDGITKDHLDALEISVRQYRERVDAWVKRTGSITDEKRIETYMKLTHPVIAEIARLVQ